MLDTALFGEDTPFSSWHGPTDGGGGGKLTSIPKKNGGGSKLRLVA